MLRVYLGQGRGTLCRHAQASFNACTRHSCNCCRELSHLSAKMRKHCTALHKGAMLKPSGTACCRQSLKRAMLMLAMSPDMRPLMHKVDKDVGITKLAASQSCCLFSCRKAMDMGALQTTN